MFTTILGPSAPRSFTATVTGSGSVELTWSSSEFPNGPLQYYEIEYESQDGIEEIAKETHRYKNISNMHYNVTGLYPYISYIFRIRGNNGGDELWGDYAETTTITQEAGSKSSVSRDFPSIYSISCQSPQQHHRMCNLKRREDQKSWFLGR